MGAGQSKDAVLEVAKTKVPYSAPLGAPNPSNTLCYFDINVDNTPLVRTQQQCSLPCTLVPLNQKLRTHNPNTPTGPHHLRAQRRHYPQNSRKLHRTLQTTGRQRLQRLPIPPSHPQLHVPRRRFYTW